MYSYTKAALGLKFMFWSRLISVIFSVMTLIMRYYLEGVIIGAIVILVCGIVDAVGLFLVSREIDECKNAFWALMIGTVLSLFKNESNIINIAASIASLVMLYYILIPISRILKTRGFRGVASLGNIIWKLQLAFILIPIGSIFLALIPIVNIVVLLVLSALGIGSIAVNIAYMVFLFKSSQCLE